MNDVPTPQQALILWCLLGRGGTALQGTLVPGGKKADRDALIAGRFLTVEKQGRALRLTVTDRGWNWAGAHMAAALPPAFRALQDWLGRIGADLAACGRPLADFVGPVPEEPPPETPSARQPVAGNARVAKGSKTAKAQKTTTAQTTTAESTAKSRAESKAADGTKRTAPTAKAAKPSQKASSKTSAGSTEAPTPGTTAGPRKTAAPGKSTRPTPALSPEHIRGRIEAAYLALTGGERAKAVRLSALRAELADLDRATVDAGLAAILGGDATAGLSKFSDPRSLDDAERDAAFSPAGEPFHILRIQS